MSIDRDYIDASYFGNEVVTSVGDWTDVEISDWDTLTGLDIPATAVMSSLSVTEKAGDASCFVLLRAEDGEATGVAWEVKAGTTEAFGLYNPDTPIRTISIYGTARLKATFYPR